MLLSEDYEDSGSEPNWPYASAEIHYSSDDNHITSTRTNVPLDPITGMNESKL